MTPQELIEQYQQAPNAGVLLLLLGVTVFSILYLSAYFLSIRSIYDLSPPLRGLCIFALLEFFIIFCASVLIGGAFLLLTKASPSSLTPEVMAENKWVFLVIPLLQIGGVYLRRYILTMITEVEGTLLQAFSSQVMQLVYFYMIPWLISILIILALG